MNSAAGASPRYATFGQRSRAYTIDSFLVIGLSLLLSWIVGDPAQAQSVDDVQALSQALTDAGLDGSGAGISLGSLFGWNDFWLPLIVSALYNILFVASPWRATPGKRRGHLQVVTTAGERLSLLHSAARHAATGLSTLLLFTGFFLAAFTRQHTTLHDLICGTRVIVVEN